MISQGERPGYRIRDAGDGTWATDFPGVSVTATDRYAAVKAARVAIAAILDVPAGAFDIAT